MDTVFKEKEEREEEEGSFMHGVIKCCAESELAPGDRRKEGG